MEDRATVAVVNKKRIGLLPVPPHPKTSGIWTPLRGSGWLLTDCKMRHGRIVPRPYTRSNSTSSEIQRAGLTGEPSGATEGRPDGLRIATGGENGDGCRRLASSAEGPHQNMQVAFGEESRQEAEREWIEPGDLHHEVLLCT